jgi:hypothetical protein
VLFPTRYFLTLRLVENQNQKALSDDPNSYIQTGLPKIPKGGSLAHFDIIKAWLDDCDKNHKRCLPMRPNLPPTRLIDVGTLELPSLRLVESSSLPQSERKLLKYIALSHPWGSSPPHVHFVTDNQNVKIHREKEIPNELPQTLADAIKTTRHLGVRYIWIDSICIIQGEGGDFAKEADRMEAVFSSAYCVIAATSAEGSSSGFLNRNSKRQLDAVVSLDDERQDPVCIPTRGTDGKATGLIFVDEPFDDFDRDVLRGSLNQRGWVFQERALARRTIHFTNNQAYWECGDGIRCETLTKMKNTRVGFLGDPNFPRYGMRGSKGGDIVFYEDLYEQYSNLAFSKFEDRPFAISGLEQRLSKALKEKGGSDLGYWGIFDDYWGRGLLWRRAAGVEKMARLTNGPSGGDAAPSWSWEGHSGGITFMKPDPHSVHWLSDEVILPWRRAQDPQARMTTASYHGERCLRGIARDFIILEKGQVNDVVKEDIIYDNDADRMERGPLKCLIIGRMNVKDRSREEVLNYILILAKKKSAPGNVYERIGAGFLDGSLIAFDENAKNVLVE